MKFQNINIHGSNSRKCDKQTNERTSQKQMPLNFFKVGGITNVMPD